MGSPQTENRNTYILAQKSVKVNSILKFVQDRHLDCWIAAFSARIRVISEFFRIFFKKGIPFLRDICYNSNNRVRLDKKDKYRRWNK